MERLNNLLKIRENKYYPLIISLILFLIFFGVYLLASRLVLNNADDTSILLEARDFMNGNFLLNNWHVPSDNFLTIEIPLYALGEKLGFSMHILTKIIPALFYSLIIALGSYITLITNTKDREYATLLFLSIAALPSLETIELVLHGPMHIGTIFLTLLGFLIYYYIYKFEKAYILYPTLIILTVFLVFGDPLSEVIFVLPLLVVAIIELLFTRFKNVKSILVIISLLISMVIASEMTTQWLNYVKIDSYATATFANLPQIGMNLIGAIRSIMLLFHTNFFGKPLTIRVLPLFVNGIFLLLYLIGVYKYLNKINFGQLTLRMRLITPIIFAFIITLIAYIFTTTPSIVAKGYVPRYITPILIFAAISAFYIIGGYLRVYFKTFILILLCVNLAVFSYYLVKIEPARQDEYDLISFLNTHNLKNGLGEYWSASAVTGESNYNIIVRQVIPLSDGYIHPYFWLENNDWYKSTNVAKDNFIVFSTLQDEFDLTSAATKTFGRPDNIYHVNEYVVLSWNHPIFKNTPKGYVF